MKKIVLGICVLITSLNINESELNSVVYAKDEIPLVSGIKEVLGDKYLKLTGSNCYDYE